MTYIYSIGRVGRNIKGFKRADLRQVTVLGHAFRVATCAGSSDRRLRLKPLRRKSSLGGPSHQILNPSLSVKAGDRGPCPCYQRHAPEGNRLDKIIDLPESLPCYPVSPAPSARNGSQHFIRYF